MRLRNIKGSREIIGSNQYVIQNPNEWKGRWKNLFNNNNPIHIEIGMGKGKFIQGLAKTNQNINYIGIEKYSSVLIRAIEKRQDYKGVNLYFIRMDAEQICEIFDENEVSQIYLNFSDPWPKDRHAKRRLTSKEFMARYNQFLVKEGEVIFKTDNSELFEFSIAEIEQAGWKIKHLTHDLHSSEYVKGNTMTEYEEKFVDLGNPIHWLVTYKEIDIKMNISKKKGNDLLT